MASLAETIAQLRGKPAFLPVQGQAGRLAPLDDFGSNPGALRAWHLAPPIDHPPSALVVVLHGCTQNAASYDQGCGWSKLAEEHGFAVLFPEQQRANNPNGCFNWFSPEDIRRDSGEVLSIRQMIDTMQRVYSIDATRIHVTGLSAGGAMACAMLATYPEVFASGAVIAGLPFDTAHGIPQALERMRGQGIPSGEALGNLVRAASQHTGRWPAISVWHGGSDRTVVPSNAKAIVDQWRHLHGAQVKPDRNDEVAGFPHRVWCDGEGREVIEEYRITGLGHGTPLATTGLDACGVAGPHMLEAGISSTLHIARSWQLLGEREIARTSVARPASPFYEAGSQIPASHAGAVIERALRAAGLMR
jgi:poly(hydroxyalkanoate) depolymerase family esterase